MVSQLVPHLLVPQMVSQLVLELESVLVSLMVQPLQLMMVELYYTRCEYEESKYKIFIRQSFLVLYTSTEEEPEFYVVEQG